MPTVPISSYEVFLREAFRSCGLLGRDCHVGRDACEARVPRPRHSKLPTTADQLGPLRPATARGRTAPARRTPPRRRGYLNLLAAATVAFVLLPSPPEGTAAAAKSPPLAVELLGGNAARSILLSPVVISATSNLPPSSGSKKNAAPRAPQVDLEGDLHLALRNPSDSKRIVNAIYTRADTDEVANIGTADLAPHAVGVLHLHFKLPGGEAPDALSGTLDLEIVGGAAGEQISVPVSGGLEPLGDVHFEPSTVILRVTRGCPILPCNTKNAGDVRLYGSGVPKLLAYRAAAGEANVATKLFLGGHAIEAMLMNLHADPTQPETAVASVSLASEPGPGKYTGTLLLSRLVPGAAGLPVEVRSRVWVPWAILTILAGVLAAAMLYQFLGLRRRKQLLSGALKAVVENDYVRHRDLNQVEGSGGQRQLIWDLYIKCPLTVEKSWEYWGDLKTARNIYTAIHWARNDADLDEAQAATMTLIHDIKSWLLALTEVRGLWELANAVHGRQEAWEETNVYRDTELLLLRARRTPGDALLSSKLIALVGLQTAWHRVFAQAWDLKQALLDAGGEASEHAAEVKLRELDEAAKPVVTRTEDDQDDLDLALERLYRKLLAIRSEFAPTADLVVLSADREQQSAARRAELESLHSSARPEVALANFRASGITALVPVIPEIEGAVAGPPPTPAVAAPQPRPADVAPQPPSAPKSRPRAAYDTVRSSATLRSFRRLDLLLSFATLVIASIVYMGTIYTDTWGSAADFATAFGAGFLGQVTVKWALLPISQSVRLRPVGTQPGAAKSATADAAS
jgi:hypothetical protein